MKELIDNDFYILHVDDALGMGPEKVAVIVYLYYEDGLDWYIDMLRKIPDGIDIYVFTSNPTVRDKVREEFINRGGFDIALKNNRGRDVSALLVSSKELFFKYDFICFLHDKDSKEETKKLECEIWVKSMWENLIYSSGYIDRVIDVLKNNKVGLLVPVIDIGKKRSVTHKNNWSGNYDNVIELLKRLDCKCEISEKVSPFSIGTMFWCNTKALRKLVSYGWKEEDFCEEPMPDDGTISHAIERCFSYVVEDAGYKSASVMSDVFCSRYINKLNDYLMSSLEIVEKAFAIRTPDKVDGYMENVEKLSTFIKDHKSIYLYGAGRMGRVCLSTMITFLDYSPDGFIDQNKAGTYYHGIKVYALEEVAKVEGAGIIISVSTKFSDEVKHILEDAGIKDYLAIYD